MLKCKICGKKFDGSEEYVAPCGHAFHVLCLVSSPTCPECKSAIDVYQEKILSDHAVSSKTEKDQESEGKNKEIGAKDQEIEAKGLKGTDEEREGKDQEIASLDPENIPDQDKSKTGVYDLSAYVETLEDRIERCTNRMNQLADVNETLDSKATCLEKQNMDLGEANLCLRRQLHMFHNFQDLNIASEDDFEKTIASLSEEPDAVQKLMHYCTTLRKQLLRIRPGERFYETKCKRVRSGNLEEPCSSNQLNEQNSEMEEIITEDEFDVLSIESEVAAEEPSCDNYAEGRDEACSSDAIENQLAEPKNVPLDANSSDVHMQDELGSFCEELSKH